MAAIDRLCRGHLSQQFFKSSRGGKTVRQGPYYVLQRWLGGKNLCERIPADQVEPVLQRVEGYKRFRQLAIAGATVMGCLEEKLRDALRCDGRQCLENLLNDPAVRLPDDQSRPGESCHAGRVNTVDSLFGPLVLRRNYDSQREREGGRVPLDESLGVVEGCTPGLARLMCRAGALEPRCSEPGGSRSVGCWREVQARMEGLRSE